MRTFSELERKEIIETYLDDHDGILKLSEFIEDARDPSHPAHEWDGWLGWDQEKLSLEALMDRGRKFIRITTQASVPVQVDPVLFAIQEQPQELRDLPMFISPLSGRGDKERGYILTNTKAGLEEMRRQAVEGEFGLKAFCKRNDAIFQPNERRLMEEAMKSLQAAPVEAKAPKPKDARRATAKQASVSPAL